MLRSLGKDIAVYGAADFVFRVIGFSVFPIYANVFSVEQFGIYALVTATTGFVALFANLGLNNAAQRYYWDPETLAGMRPVIVSTGLGILTAWSCGIVLLFIAGLYPAQEFIASSYGIAWTIALMALLTVIPEQIVQYCLDILRLHFAPWKFVFVSFLKNVLGVATGLVLILLFDGGLEGLFTGALVGALSAVPIALVLIRRDLTTALGSETARRLVAFGYPFIFAGAAYWLFGLADRWMLAELGDTIQLGLYAIAYKFAAIVLFFNTAFGQAWSPFALKLRYDDADYRAAYSRVFSVWFFFLVMVGSAVALFGKEALAILTPPEYQAASPILGVLVMGVVLFGTTQISAIGISLERRTRLFATAAWITAFANVLLNFLLIPQWGPLGAAFATFLSYGVLTGLYLYWSQTLHPIPLEKPKLLYSAALVLSMVAASVGYVDVEPSVAVAALKISLLALMLAGGVALRIIDITAVKTLITRKRRA